MQLNSDTYWAVSQSSPIRRLDINGNLFLYENDSTGYPGFSSGGFMADVYMK